MNKLFIILITVLTYGFTQAFSQNNIKWQQSFTNSELPEGWQVIDADESGSGLILVNRFISSAGDTIFPYAGDYFWTSNVQNANLAGTIDEWLISPRISVIYKGDSLYFWAGANANSFDDSLRVFISTINNDPANFKYKLANFKVQGPAGSWHRYGFDLSEFDSLDIYFAINYYIKSGGPGGQHSDLVWIDNAVISGDPSTLNNAPAFISLKEPVHESILDKNLDSINFKWSASQDKDGDSLFYTLSIVDLFPELHFNNLTDSSFSLEWADILLESTEYRWTVKVTDGKSTVASLDTFSFELAGPLSITSDTFMPKGPVLYQNYPNPFNPRTYIKFRISEAAFVALNIYNMLGELVANIVSENLVAGEYTYPFEVYNLSSGIYFYKLETEDFTEIKKMILIK